MNFKSKRGWLLCALALGACGDNAGGDDDPGDGEESPFMVSTTIFTSDTATTYFGLVPTLDSGSLDLTGAIESPGMAKLYAGDRLGWFALGGGEQPTVTRYELGPGDTLVEGDTITFQPRGTSYLGDTMVFVSATAAYYFDAPNMQLIRWNPEAMTVDGAIDLTVAEQPGLTAIFDLKPLLRDDGSLVFPVTWRNFESDETVPGTGLVVIDTATDEIRSYTVSEACQGIAWSTSIDGVMYAGTAPFYALLQRITGDGPPSCVLRVLPGADTFDPDYRVDLAELTGGRVAGGLARGREGELYFRALEPEVEVGPESDASAIWADAVWTWQRWQLSDGTVSPVDSLPPSAAGGLTYDVADHVFATDSAADFSETTLIDLTAEGGPRPALTAPGYIYGVARLR